MRIVTLEEHVLTPDFAAATRKFTTGPAAKVRANMEPALLDMGAGRLQAMDEAGIDVQVLSLAANRLDLLPPDEAMALAADSNDRIGAAVAARPDRFAGFATIVLTDVEAAVRETHRAVDQLGFAGIVLRGMTQGLFLDDDRFDPVWAAVEALHVPVYLHPPPVPPAVEQAYWSGLSGKTHKLMAITTREWHAEMGLQVLRLIVSGLFDRHPELRLIVGHTGEDLPGSIARADGVFNQMGQHLRRPVEEYFHRHFWITTSGFFAPTTFASALEVIGIDRMLFSIDYPFSSTGRGRAFLDSLELSAGDRRSLAHANADELLGLRTSFMDPAPPLAAVGR